MHSLQTGTGGRTFTSSPPPVNTILFKVCLMLWTYKVQVLLIALKWLTQSWCLMLLHRCLQPPPLDPDCLLLPSLDLPLKFFNLHMRTYWQTSCTVQQCHGQHRTSCQAIKTTTQLEEDLPAFSSERKGYGTLRNWSWIVYPLGNLHSAIPSQTCLSLLVKGADNAPIRIVCLNPFIWQHHPQMTIFDCPGYGHAVLTIGSHH